MFLAHQFTFGTGQLTILVCISLSRVYKRSLQIWYVSILTLQHYIDVHVGAKQVTDIHFYCFLSEALSSNQSDHFEYFNCMWVYSMSSCRVVDLFRMSC